MKRRSERVFIDREEDDGPVRSQECKLLQKERRDRTRLKSFWKMALMKEILMRHERIENEVRLKLPICLSLSSYHLDLQNRHKVKGRLSSKPFILASHLHNSFWKESEV